MKMIAPALGAALALVACGGPPGAKLPTDALDRAIGGAIGDPSTCVLVARASDHKVVYRYGQLFNCQRGLPACDRPGFLSALGTLAFAAQPGGRRASCASVADGSRQVGWAQGPVPGRPYLYSAVMEGDRALPGQEMAARLEAAFTRAGL